MEVSGRRMTGSEEERLVCETCTDRRSDTRAVYGYCIECHVFLCEECYHVHLKLPPCKNHKLLEGKQMPKRKLVPIDTCETHKDEKILYFCKTHSALACQKCAFLQHRMCKDVDEISAVSADADNDQFYKLMTNSVQYLEQTTDNIRQNWKQNISKIESNKTQAKADIKKFCKAIHEHLYMLEQAMDKEVDQLSEEDSKHMDKIQQECDSVSADIKVITTMLEANQAPSQREQLFIAMQKVANTIEMLTDKLTKLHAGNTVKDYKFDSDDRLEAVRTNVKKVGQLLICGGAGAQATEQDGGVRSRARVQHAQPNVRGTRAWAPDNVTAETDGVNNVTAETDGGINVKTETDKYACWITGIVMLEGDKTLAIADRKNSSLKLVDVRQKKVIAQAKLPNCPRDVTRVPQDQLAVTVPVIHRIQFLSVTKGTLLSLGHQLRVSAECHGVAYNNDRLFVSFTKPVQVQILSMSGTVLHTIGSQTDGQIQLERPFCLTTGADQSTFFVSDECYHTVYCLDTNGKMKANFQDEKLRYASGMCTVGNSSMIVCGDASRNLYVMSSDCKKGKILVDKSRGVCSPNSVAYNRVTDTLYLGQYDSNMLKAFKLKYSCL